MLFRSKEIEKNPEILRQNNFDGIIIPGGFGSGAIEGKIKAIKYARENNLPFLGLCLGLQLAVVEFARNVCNLEKANSTEIDSSTEYPVIDILPEQREVAHKGGTMRLGRYKAIVNGKVKELYNAEEIYERHRHRYEVNPDYHHILRDNGLRLSGMSEDGRLVEFIEIPEHKFFIATQRSEEHTSELQSHSFISYAVFCLKKKKKYII